MIGNGFSWGQVRRQAWCALSATLAAAVIGCGSGEEKVAGKTETPLRVPVEQTATVASMPSRSAQPQEGEVVASADSLSPEIAVEVEETTVEPGEAVEITALGSPDVRDVLLTDGMGKTTSFVYDLQAKAWKAYYRVPMKLHGDRLGLSVTAKNDGNRWRRVWLFLEIKSSMLSTTSGAAPDSVR